MDSGRLAASTDLCFEDLCRHNLLGVTIERNHPMNLPGFGSVTAPIYVKQDSGAELIVGVHGPLTPDEPSDPILKEVKEFCPSVPVILVDEMVIQRNLPTATSQLISQIG